MKFKILYIDDDERELKKYKNKFETDSRLKNKFSLITSNPPKCLEDYARLSREEPQLMLIDFDLTKPDYQGRVISISGVSLATELRQKCPDIPIILFTRKSVFNDKDYYVKQTLSSIDQVIYKSELFKIDSKLLYDLYVLAEGFKKLSESTPKLWKNLLKIINAPPEDYEKLKASNPSISIGLWTVSNAANWIRNTLMAYPGILYDSLHAATFLGISESAFLTKNVQQFFEKAEYSGVLASSDKRWWKSALSRIATNKMNKDELNLSFMEGFHALWRRIKHVSLEKSKCAYSGESPADWVCFILKKPVMIKYSLAYKIDARPAVMDEARVSYQAIRTSDLVDETLFDPIGQELLKKIRDTKKKRT